MNDKLVFERANGAQPTTRIKINVRAEDAALVDEIANETGRTKTWVIGKMIRFAYEHLELVDSDEQGGSTE